MADDKTPGADPVGERNYALGRPSVRPEGQGTPGAMHQHAPVEPTPVPAVVPDADVVKTTDHPVAKTKPVAPVAPKKA